MPTPTLKIKANASHKGASITASYVTVNITSLVYNGSNWIQHYTVNIFQDENNTSEPIFQIPRSFVLNTNQQTLNQVENDLKSMTQFSNILDVP